MIFLECPFISCAKIFESYFRTSRESQNMRLIFISFYPLRFFQLQTTGFASYHFQQLQTSANSMNVKQTKNWFSQDNFSLLVTGEHNQYRKLQTSVKGFIEKQSGANKLLYRFKNILMNELQQSVTEIDDLSIDKIALLYMPFIFSIFALPVDMAMALTISYLGVKKEDIKSLDKMERQTIYFQAKQALMSSLMYGSKYTDQALQMMQKTGKLKEFGGLIGDTVNSIASTVKATGDRLSKWFSSAASYFKSASTSELQAQYQAILLKINDLNHNFIGALGKTELFRNYMTNVKLYGKILIDFYYLINFAIRTSAYGRQVMYIPQLPNLLFQLKNGIPKVYFKGPSQIKVIPQVQFTQEFIYGLAKGIKAKDNADVVLQFNENVSNVKAKGQTKRQVFKKELQDGSYLQSAIKKDMDDFVNLSDEAAMKAALKTKTQQYEDKLKQKRKDLGLQP